MRYDIAWRGAMLHYNIPCSTMLWLTVLTVLIVLRCTAWSCMRSFCRVTQSCWVYKLHHSNCTDSRSLLFLHTFILIPLLPFTSFPLSLLHDFFFSFSSSLLLFYLLLYRLFYSTFLILHYAYYAVPHYTASCHTMVIKLLSSSLPFLIWIRSLLQLRPPTFYTLLCNTALHLTLLYSTVHNSVPHDSPLLSSTELLFSPFPLPLPSLLTLSSSLPPLFFPLHIVPP